MSLAGVEAFYRPDAPEGVVELLEKHSDSALIVAGGTFLHGLIARGLLTGIEALIDIQHLGLDYINNSADGTEIGAMTRFSAIKASPEVQSQAWLGAIRDAVEYPPAQVMNAATVGGCVASSCPFFDLPVSFLALNAIVNVHGPAGRRDIELEAFFPGLFENALDPAEFVTSLRVAPTSANTASAFTKLETNANDLALVNVAVSLATNGAGKCEEARVFVGGGVGETVVRAPSAEQTLTGAVLGPAIFTQAGDAAKADVDPIADHRASAEYRTAMVKVLLERTLQRAADRLS
ncbi:MAG: FAD binding domain-containing protein [Gammaproteobacteria bacterium]|nr:FAD binding domain-containing protein [Gammaproteobacteria bacterium]HJP36578.1 FAD binding domain-containing protein [Gammaproteobacteria bacterium]